MKVTIKSKTAHIRPKRDVLFSFCALIKVEKKQNELLVSIIDTGLGISKANCEKLLRIDQTYSTSGTNKEKGSGLGLILCKEFVKKHGGKIWVESQEEKGSVFYFTLSVVP